MTTCDLCGREQKDRRWGADSKWADDAYEEVKVECTTTEMSRESRGEVNGEAWDFCPDCFKSMVRPLLISLVKPRKVEEDW